MSRNLSVFYKVVSNENSTTELLCNLLRFQPVREKITALLLSKPLGEDVPFDSIDTQVRDGDIQPDITIKTETLLAYIEVKTDEKTGLTENQPGADFSKLNADQNKSLKCLTFLIPPEYAHKAELRRRIDLLKCENSQVGVKIVCWNEVFEILESSDLADLSPVVAEFSSLLKLWYRAPTLELSRQEIDTMYSNEIPRVYRTLDTLVNYLESQLIKRDYKVSRARTKEENAIYVQDSSGEALFYIGVWNPFWEKEGVPLAFGVPEKQSKNVIDTFRRTAGQHLKTFQGWHLSWLDSSNFFGDDSATKIWKGIDDALWRVLEASKADPESTAS